MPGLFCDVTLASRLIPVAAGLSLRNQVLFLL